MMVLITAIILASGLSRRMGTDKLLLTINDKPMIEHTIEAIKCCHFKEVILVSHNETILGIGKRLGVTTIKNDDPNRGQSYSVKLGVTHAEPENDFMFFVGDQPFIKKEMIFAIIDVFHSNPGKLIIPTNEGLRGSPVIFPNFLKDQLLCLSGDIGGRAVIQKNPEMILEVPIQDKLSFKDIDTPSDYRNIIL